MRQNWKFKIQCVKFRLEMNDRLKSWIVTCMVLFVIIGLLLGGVFFLLKYIRAKGGSSAGDNTKVVKISPSPSLTPGSTVIDTFKTYKDNGFELKYPKSWGLLTCNNSKNIEFDPINPTDFVNVACEKAQKPVTVLAGNKNCKGEAIKLGKTEVIRSKESIPGFTKYRWCINLPAGGPALDITHRVSSDGSRATSKEDFSSLVEKIIVDSF